MGWDQLTGWWEDTHPVMKGAGLSLDTSRQKGEGEKEEEEEGSLGNSLRGNNEVLG